VPLIRESQLAQEDKMQKMKAYLVFTYYGPVLVLTKHDFKGHPELLSKLAAVTSEKFIAHEVSIDSVRANYDKHFSHVLGDPTQAGDIKILDDRGEEIFTNVRFKDLSAPIYYDPD
jgi:hypothetical protein